METLTIYGGANNENNAKPDFRKERYITKPAWKGYRNIHCHIKKLEP